MKTEVKAIATVRIEIELPHEGGHWGGECSLEQLRKQAEENAIGRLQQALNKVGVPMRIIGAPTVTAHISVTEK